MGTPDPFGTITIDQFSRARLAVATIVEAKPHPNADKLLTLRVDLGTEGKHSVAVVAGIRQHYTPESLVGKQIVVVTNLQPTKLRGEPSEAMLLAASDEEGNLSLLTPDKPIKVGSLVR